MPSIYKTCKLTVEAIKDANNIGSKKVIMKNKVIRDKSRFTNCMAGKSRFLKQNNNKESSWSNLDLKVLIY